MIPIGAIVAAAVLAARYAAEQKKEAEGGKGPVARGEGVHTRRTFQSRSGLFALVWLFVWPLWLGLLASIAQGASLASVAAAVVLTPLCVPWPLVRRVAIPLGLPRTAWFITHFADWTWGRDRSGGAVLAAVLAARAHRRPQDLAWARQKVQGVSLISAAGVIADALLADVDGDAARRDALLATLATFDARVVPRTARQIAAEQRIATLLAAGAWLTVANLDDDALGGSRFGWFARVCAGRIARDAPSTNRRRTLWDDLLVRAWWLANPRRRRTLPLLRRALAADVVNGDDSFDGVERDAGERPAEAAPSTSTPEPAAALPRAVALHVATTQMKEPTVFDVAALASAWDPALLEARRDLVARAHALGVHDVDGVARGVDDTVTDALCSLVQRLDLSTTNIQEQPALLQVAVERVRSERLDALEMATIGLRQRAESQTDLAAVDELREFAAIRALYEGVRTTGADARALAWDACQWTVCEVAVRLWNVRHEHRLANAMFRWLLAEATALKDTRGIETQTANVNCGP